MGLFDKKVTQVELENVRVGHRLAEGKLKKEIATKEALVGHRDSKIELLEAKITDLETQRDYFKGLENDREKLEAEKKVIKIDREDLTEDKKLYEHRLERFKKREAELEETENGEYKKGYSDGLADGLRKAHDITREDRKYLTMIAMSTNQSEAIKTSQKALEGGFKDDSSDAKS